MCRLRLLLVVLTIVLIVVVCPGCPPKPTSGPPLPGQPTTVSQDTAPQGTAPASPTSSLTLAEKAPECPLPTDLRMYKVANMSEDAFSSYLFMSLVTNGAVRTGKDDADICVVRAIVAQTNACVVTRDKFGNPYAISWNPSQSGTGEKAVKGFVDALLCEQRFKWERSQSQPKAP